MITAQSADGTLHQFPDGTPDSVIDGAMKSYAQQDTSYPGTPSIAQESGETIDLGSPLARAARGIVDPLTGGVQLGAHAVDAVAGTKYAPSFDKSLQQDEARYQSARAADGSTGTDWWRIGGNFASPVNYIAPEIGVASKIGLAGRVGMSALNGGFVGALQPVTDGSKSYAQQKLGQAITGTVAGAALPLAAPLAKAGGRTVAATLGNMTTGAGGRSVVEAFNSGLSGGDQGAAFLSNISGDANPTDIVDQARSALAKMRADRNATYRSGMMDISNDKTVLSMDPINQSLSEANKIGSFKGQTLGGSGDVTWNALNDTIGNWAKLDPAEYHTPEGLDFLKQQVGQIMADTKPNTPASTMAGKVYRAVKGAIKDQAPTYAKVMSDYSDASDAVNDIQRELSLGPKGNPATALRKLQSVMRDNVNTSWGQRADYADTLEGNGAKNIMPSLAGQALSPIMPRGLAKYGDLGLALGISAFHNPMGIAALPLMSPKIVGYGAYGLGALARKMSPLAPNLLPVTLPRIAGSAATPVAANYAPNGAN